MHQEAFPGEDISDRPPPEDSVPGLLALIEGDAPERPLPRPRARRGLGVSALAFELPRAARGARAAGGARPAPRRRAAAGRRAPRRRDRPRALPRPAAVPRAGRPARRQHLGDAAGRRPCDAPDGERLELRLSTPAPRPRPDACWVVELRRGDGTRSRGGRRRRAARAAGRRRRPGSSRPTPAPRLWLARLDLPGPLARLPRRHGQPIRYGYVPRRWPLAAYQNVYATSPAAPRWPSAGRPVHGRAGHRLVAAASSSRRSRCTPASPRPSATSRPYPERYRVPERDRAARQRRARGGAAA